MQKVKVVVAALKKSALAVPRINAKLSAARICFSFDSKPELENFSLSQGSPKTVYLHSRRPPARTCSQPTATYLETDCTSTPSRAMLSFLNSIFYRGMHLITKTDILQKGHVHERLSLVLCAGI